MHIGKSPSKITHEMLRAANLTREQISPATAWKSAVQYAIAHDLDCVCIAGDAIDATKLFFEAVGPLEEGFAQLHGHGIPVIFIAGNHDAKVLQPVIDRIVATAAADTSTTLHVIGAGGAWESKTITGKSGNKLQVVGWSFPDTFVTHRAFDSYTAPVADPDAALTIGMFHGDLFDQASRYAPFRHDDLRASGVRTWLLGHIHKPDDIASGDYGYLGSISALDPSDDGWRGAWILESRRGATSFRRLALTPLRYENVTVNVSDCTTDNIYAFIDREITELATRVAIESERATRLIVSRLTFTGRVSDIQGVTDTILKLIDDGFVRTIDGITIASDNFQRIQLLPELDYAAIAEASDLRAPLARLLVGADAGSAEKQLVQRIQQRITSHALSPTFRDKIHASAADLSSEELHDLITTAAGRLLDQLVPHEPAQAVTAGRHDGGQA